MESCQRGGIFESQNASICSTELIVYSWALWGNLSSWGGISIFQTATFSVYLFRCARGRYTYKEEVKIKYFYFRLGIAVYFCSISCFALCILDRFYQLYAPHEIIPRSCLVLAILFSTIVANLLLARSRVTGSAVHVSLVKPFGIIGHVLSVVWCCYTVALVLKFFIREGKDMEIFWGFANIVISIHYFCCSRFQLQVLKLLGSDKDKKKAAVFQKKYTRVLFGLISFLIFFAPTPLWFLLLKSGAYKITLFFPTSLHFIFLALATSKKILVMPKKNKVHILGEVVSRSSNNVSSIGEDHEQQPNNNAQTDSAQTDNAQIQPTDNAQRQQSNQSGEPDGGQVHIISSAQLEQKL